jgi:hypothetical protein
MKDIDLDIRNYNAIDMENFLQLTGKKYDEVLLDEKCSEYLQKITKLETIDSAFKDAFRTFLQEGRELLIRERLAALRNSPVTKTSAEIVKQENVELYPKPIVSKADLPFVYAHNSEFFGGTLNPLEKHLSKRVVSIDSLFRDNYATTSASDFVFRFSDPIKNVASIELMSIELPVYSWYDVTEENGSNYFTLSYSGMTGFQDSLQKVVLADGNYTISEMHESISAALLALGGGFVHILCDLDLVSSKFLFRSDLECSFTIHFETSRNNMLYENLGWKLGFRKSIYNGNFANRIGADSAYIPFVDQYIFLEIDDFNRNNQSNAIIAYTDSKTLIGDNIIARISIQEITLQGVSQIFKKREYFGGVRLEKLRIRLLNRYGKPLQMKCSDYSIGLELKQIYC